MSDIRFFSWLRSGIVLAVFFLAVNISCAATNVFFPQGVELGRAGQFSDAASAFEKSARTQPAAGTLVNLGIAEWQRGHAGEAILAWEQARWIDPRDSRAGANLAFARQAAQLDAPQLKWFEIASTWLPPNDWAWLAGVSLWLAAGLMTLPGIFRRRKTGWQQALAALAFGVFLFCITANAGVVGRTQIGFVLKKNAPLLLAPASEAEIVSTLSAGVPARRLRTRGNYFFIRTTFSSGWISRDQFGLVSSDRPVAGK